MATPSKQMFEENGSRASSCPTTTTKDHRERLRSAPFTQSGSGHFGPCGHHYATSVIFNWERRRDLEIDTGQDCVPGRDAGLPSVHECWRRQEANLRAGFRGQQGTDQLPGTQSLQEAAGGVHPANPGRRPPEQIWPRNRGTRRRRKRGHSGLRGAEGATQSEDARWGLPFMSAQQPPRHV